MAAFRTAAHELVPAGLEHRAGAVVRRLADGATLATVSPAQEGAQADSGTVTKVGLDPAGSCLLYHVGAGQGIAGLSPDFQQAFVLQIGSATCPPVVPGPASNPPPGAGAGPPGSGGPQGLDRRPVVDRVTVRPRRFRVAGRRRGTVIGFRLRNARSRVVVSMGRRTRVRRTKRFRYVPAGRIVRASVRTGTRRIRFAGRTDRGRLRPGRYRLTIRATALTGGLGSRPTAPVRFRVVR